MQRPKKYSVFITDPNGKRTIEDTNMLFHSYYDFLKRKGCKVEIYIDTRYNARCRLYRIHLYHTDREQYEKEFKRSIYHGTEIGKTIPILNF